MPPSSSRRCSAAADGTVSELVGSREPCARSQRFFREEKEISKKCLIFCAQETLNRNNMLIAELRRSMKRQRQQERRVRENMSFFIFLGGAMTGGMIGVVMMCLMQINRCEDCPARMKSGQMDK